MSVSRRQFLGRAALGATALASSGTATTASQPSRPSRPGSKGERPRRIIHLVADGMSQGTLTCADYFSRLERNRGLRCVEVLNQPGTILAWMNMRSLNSAVTDSSAASSSWGCGSRVKNGSLNILPDGRRLRTLYQLFGEAGWKRGLVTTTEITHATPAGFAANVPTRDDAELVAVQYLDREIEVLLGGGTKVFDPVERKDERDLFADYRSRGYVVFRTRHDLERADFSQRWLGTFTKSHLPYTIDQRNDPELVRTVPTLAEMTTAALRRLENEKRFILQVEGGRVDHACHACDAATAMREMVAFDEAVAACLEFQKRQPDTLVVITTDHGNGNPGLIGTGDDYGKTPKVFRYLRDVHCSFSEISKKVAKLTAGREAEEIAVVIADTTGYRPDATRAAALVPFLAKKGFAMFDHMNSSSTQLGQLMANHVGIGWSGSSHTADYVSLAALGPGAERFRGFIQNTDVFHHYLALAGIDFRNPQSPLLAECAPSFSPVEPVESPADWV